MSCEFVGSGLIGAVALTSIRSVEEVCGGGIVVGDWSARVIFGGCNLGFTAADRHDVNFVRAVQWRFLEPLQSAEVGR